MSRSQSLAIVLLLTLLASGCRGNDASPSARGQSLPLKVGGFVPRTGVADLRGSPSAPAESRALWSPRPAVQMEGWGPAGRAWSPVGTRSTLRLWRRSAGGTSLRLDFNQRPATPSDTYQVDIVLNDREVGVLETTPGRSQHRFPLPQGLLRSVNQLDLRFDPPVELVEGPSPLTIVRVGIDRGTAVPSGSKSSPGTWITEGGGIAMTRTGVYLIPCDIPVGSHQLQMRARSLGGGLVHHRLFVMRERGQQVDLVAGQLADSGWQDLKVSLESFQGESVVIGWDVDFADGGGRVELGKLVLTPVLEDQTTPSPVSVPRASDAARPDIILIILDAARGDRFPGWDYPRRTMPNIDELGRQSSSFLNAFSECPTTSCSVPAMISGVPFLPGGEVGQGPKLADEVKTLAEYLADLGYSTAGFSATPNNSASRNLDQGFQVFRKLWGPGNPDHGPFNMSRLAGEVIREQPADEPLFLQLHFLPPHQPYDPGPEFDRFTDPQYSGSIRPGMSLKSYNLGLASLEGKDLDHLVALYDGNLSVADEAVGQVLAALRTAGRFDDAMIVITSDHGEAFMEHGRQGHNTTLFDEMLHVPLLVRLPGGATPESFDPDRLASVLDIVPTVLGVVDGTPLPEVGGLDLFSTKPDPLRPRVLFSRTSHPRHTMLAARTAGWKAISWARLNVQMLFDLEEDPEEAENLVGERPLVFAGFGLRIRQHLLAAANLVEGEDEIEITDEEREALRALGYLN
jgi:arylsulfatase A-like enzyme